MDALIVEHAPGHLYALRGRTWETEYRGLEVAAEHFRQPHWESTRGFVVMYDQGDDRQTRATFMPASLQPLTPGPHIVPSNREMYYDRDEASAQKAAADIAAFLQHGTMPRPPEPSYRKRPSAQRV